MKLNEKNYLNVKILNSWIKKKHIIKLSVFHSSESIKSR
jgi:hypothetical protein